MHIPLIISGPGQKNRIDVNTATSSLDLLPTLASLAGAGTPEWAEGTLLPELGGIPDEDRSIYAIEGKTNSAYGPLTRVSVALHKSGHRLTYYQYPDRHHRSFELYDLDDDPDELHDLFGSGPQVAAQMQDELLQKLAEVNRPYQA